MIPHEQHRRGRERDFFPSFFLLLLVLLLSSNSKANETLDGDNQKDNDDDDDNHVLAFRRGLKYVEKVVEEIMMMKVEKDQRSEGVIMMVESQRVEVG